MGDRNQDVWLAAVIATAAGVFQALFLSRVARLLSGRTLIEFLDEMGFAGINKIVSLVFITFPLAIATITMRDFAELMVSVFFPETPMVVFIACLGILAAWAAYEGFEVIVRMSELLLPLVVVLMFLSGFLALAHGNSERFLPVLDNGWAPVLRGAVTQWALFGDVAVWLLLVPQVSRTGRKFYFLPAAVLAAGAILVLSLGFIIYTLGAEVAVQRTYPFLSMVQAIALAGFLERLEGGFMMIWIITNYIKITVFFYAGLNGLRQLLKRKKRGLDIISLMILTGAMSIIMFDNHPMLRNFFRPEIYVPFSALYQIIVPAILVVIWAIRNRRKLAAARKT